jgi:hypothetical protein
MTAQVMPEAPIGGGRPTQPATRLDAQNRLIYGLQADRADQVDRARRAEAMVDHLRTCLTAVGAGVDLTDALDGANRRIDQLERELSDLVAAVAGVVRVTVLEPRGRQRGVYVLTDNHPLNEAAELLRRRHGVEAYPTEAKS